jgi:hypothetical protein
METRFREVDEGTRKSLENKDTSDLGALVSHNAQTNLDEWKGIYHRANLQECDCKSYQTIQEYLAIYEEFQAKRKPMLDALKATQDACNIVLRRQTRDAYVKFTDKLGIK